MACSSQFMVYPSHKYNSHITFKSPLMNVKSWHIDNKKNRPYLSFSLSDRIIILSINLNHQMPLIHHI